ncbi:hypothetical protein AWB75_05984 [Caballeronia catudaia]|uniref:Uncharacterized protein n=1 Tax=Caballeronia catudaia TaxID=1777136 RepID=A0A158D1Q2_9BURK|nr:hypothetical protein [Caballeronia catudaia]SAK87767.1 hypothetical protein AWB75_05984 [Caballeronia catudaia]
MNKLRISVDAHGHATLSQLVQISEHCGNRARLLTSLVNIVAAPGGFERFCAYPETVRRDMLELMRSVAEEQLPLIAALEEHATKSGYERGAQAAREVLVHEEQAANSALHYDAENQPAQLLIPH